MRWLFLGLLGVCSLQAQQLRNIQSYGLSHSSVRWVFESDLPCYHILFGTTSGVYPYSSYSLCNTDKKASVIISGLAPNTTYYFRITVRPNPNDDIGICKTEDCGSPEFVLTTLPEPAVHPALPEPPKAWNPQPPDTSGYFIVPMKNGGTDGTECVAAADVPGASVHENDQIDSLLSNIPYGTVLEFPQGIECIVPAERNAGYVLPRKPMDPSVNSLDSPLHKWIVLRTAAGGAGDFPPFGARTGASFASKLAKFIAVAPTYWVEPANSGKGRSQLFTAEGGGQHHFWFENLEFTTTKDPNRLPAKDTTDPAPYSPLFGTFPTFPEQVPPTITHIVLDRIYIHGQGHPSRYTRGIMLGGAYEAMIGCAMENLDFWQMPSLPQESPTLNSGQTILSIPPVQFSRNAKEPPIGTTAPATATLFASLDFTGQYWIQLGPDTGTLKILYTQTSVGAIGSIACQNCTAILQPTLDLPYNGYRYCTGTIRNAQFSQPDCALAIWQTSRYGYGWGTIGLELMDGGTGPYYLANNFMGAVGMGIYVDAGGGSNDFVNNISYADNSNDDMVFVRNHVMWSEDHRITSPLSNGFRYPVRNLFETKRSRRWLMQGNLFQNFWSYQNDGAAIFFSSAAAPYPITNRVSGILDQTVSSNIIRHGAVGIEILGALSQYSAGEQAANYLIENNLIYDLAARHKYSDGDPSLHTGSLGSGARDLTFRHNTVGVTYGDMPTLLFADTSASVMEGLSYTDNIVYLSQGGTAGGFWFREWNNYPRFPRLPAIDWTSYKSMLDTSYIRTPQSGPIPNYSFSNNVIIAGKTYLGSGIQVADMTRGHIQALQSQFPPGNHFPMGDTLAERETVAGLRNATRGDFRLLPDSPYAKGALFAAADKTSQGVDHDRLETDLGLVTNIAPVSVLLTEAVFQYTAPDSKACVVDVTSTGRSWSRTTDSGGARERTVHVTIDPRFGYQYRILCYYQQVNDGLRYTDYTADQITDGSFQGLAVPRRR